MFRLLVAGGRDYYNYKLIDEVLTTWFNQDYLEFQAYLTNGLVIVHGDAAGADRIAAQWAKYNSVESEAHIADWKKLGRAAGAIRNAEMISTGLDYALLFPGGVGTFNMKHQLQKAKIEFREVLDPTYI